MTFVKITVSPMPHQAHAFVDTHADGRISTSNAASDEKALAMAQFLTGGNRLTSAAGARS